MSKENFKTPMLDELENGPWPSFISGFKRLRDDHPDQRIRDTADSLLGQLEHSYETRKGYWKGGTVSVFGYGAGIIPRFSEVEHKFKASKEFHTLRIQPTPGNWYNVLRSWASAMPGSTTHKCSVRTVSLLWVPPPSRLSTSALELEFWCRLIELHR